MAHKWWHRGGSSTNNISSTTGAVGSSGYVSADAIASAPKNSAIDDVKMDLGIKPKNTAYYRDLEKRGQAAKDAVAKMRENRKDKNDEKAAAAAEETPKEEEVAETASTEQSEVERLEELIEKLSQQTYGGNFDPTFVSGEAEQKVVDREEKGTKSGTIKTSPQGLTTQIDPDDPNVLRIRRSLLASA